MNGLPTTGAGYPLSYTVRRAYVDTFLAREVERLPAGAALLDLGGHKGRKRGRFDVSAYPLRVTCANITVAKGADVQADAALLPFAPAAFDAVLCAELLEHVPDPRPVLAQVRRVLRPGGTLLITVPFLYRMHADPFDFGRYTDGWWRAVLVETGFGVARLEKQGLYFGVLADMIGQAADLFAVRPLRSPVEWLLSAAKQGAAALDGATFVQRHPLLSSYTTGFGIVAHAAGPAQEAP